VKKYKELAEGGNLTMDVTHQDVPSTPTKSKLELSKTPGGTTPRRKSLRVQALMSVTQSGRKKGTLKRTSRAMEEEERRRPNPPVLSVAPSLELVDALPTKSALLNEKPSKVLDAKPSKILDAKPSKVIESKPKSTAVREPLPPKETLTRKVKMEEQPKEEVSRHTQVLANARKQLAASKSTIAKPSTEKTSLPSVGTSLASKRKGVNRDEPQEQECNQQ
jgi:hypothetical protein